jgi:hypothetical protein
MKMYYLVNIYIYFTFAWEEQMELRIDRQGRFIILRSSSTPGSASQVLSMPQAASAACTGLSEIGRHTASALKLTTWGRPDIS